MIRSILFIIVTLYLSWWLFVLSACADFAVALPITAEDEGQITFAEWQAEGMPEIIIIGDTYYYPIPKGDL